MSCDPINSSRSPSPELLLSIQASQNLTGPLLAAGGTTLPFLPANLRRRRPIIALDLINQEPTVTHDGKPCSVVLRRDLISVGCADITITAARYLLAQYDKTHSDQPFEKVLQP